MTDFDPYGRLIFVDNDFRVSSSTDTHRVINPANLAHEGDVAVCDVDECEAVIARAKAAQVEWAKLD
ncbi:MAG: aldehyde dehydrogenase family protein, partial [Gammaproteobacteria bacterium]